jgi:hypothetical protein
VCYDKTVDVFDCDIDKTDRLSVHPSESDDSTYFLRVSTLDGLDKLSFGSSTGPGNHFVVTSLGSIDRGDDVMLVTDQSATHKSYTCSIIDSIAAKVPKLQFARANNMARCVGCAAADYKAVRSQGGFLQLCMHCAANCDVMDRVRAVTDSHSP